jgi:3alpha(or 20beta)-hydroxysteroid dehydrogenase
MGKLEGKVALITGSARGQGATEARLFLAEGARVVITDVLDKLGTHLVAELGPDTTYCHLDVSSETDWRAAVRHTLDVFGALHILVNNAGINVTRRIEDTTVEEFMRIVSINQLGSWLGIKSVMEPMRAAGGGSIVNIVSCAVVAGIAGKTAYVGSKHAMRGISRAAAGELGHYGIRVNAILPGGIDSDMTRGVLGPDRFAGNPIPRIGRPDEVAQAVLFFASDESTYCTGSELLVDGGHTATPLPQTAPSVEAATPS